MSGAASRGETPHHGAVRAAIAAFVRVHGKKRGVFLAAEAIGMGERAARHAYEGSDFAADEERAARADAARLTLLLEQIAQLNAEAAQIHPRGMNVGKSMAGVLARARTMLAQARGAADGEGPQGIHQGAMVVTP